MRFCRRELSYLEKAKKATLLFELHDLCKSFLRAFFFSGSVDDARNSVFFSGPLRHHFFLEHTAAYTTTTSTKSKGNKTKVVMLRNVLVLVQRTTRSFGSRYRGGDSQTAQRSSGDGTANKTVLRSQYPGSSLPLLRPLAQNPTAPRFLSYFFYASCIIRVCMIYILRIYDVTHLFAPVVQWALSKPK